MSEHSKQEFPPRNTDLDCGVFASYFVLHELLGIEYPSVAQMRSEIDKEMNVGIMPSQIVDFLRNKGLQVTYYSSLYPYLSKILKNGVGSEYLVAAFNKMMQDNNIPGAISTNQLDEYIAFFRNNPGLFVIQDENSQFDIKGSLKRDGAMVILLVNASHYIVAIGVNDSGALLIYDPDSTERELLEISEEEVHRRWAIDIVIHDREEELFRFPFREAIVVNRANDASL